MKCQRLKFCIYSKNKTETTNFEGALAKLLAEYTFL